MTASGEIDPLTFEQLERLARSQPRSVREAQAKAWAIRTLERLARDGRRRRVPRCRADWHPLPGTAWEELDRGDDPETRQRWWEAWCGGR